MKPVAFVGTVPGDDLVHFLALMAGCVSLQHVKLEGHGLEPEQPITCSWADTSADILLDLFRPLPLVVA